MVQPRQHSLDGGQHSHRVLGSIHGRGRQQCLTLGTLLRQGGFLHLLPGKNILPVMARHGKALKTSLKRSEEAEGRPSEVSLIFFLEVGCYIGKILGLRQTKKGVKIVAMAGR